MKNAYPFPTATHSYFRAKNKQEQKELFLEGAIDQPIFHYSKLLQAELLEDRIQLVANDVEVVKRLKFVQSFITLQKDPGTLQDYRVSNLTLFHEPTEQLASAILWRMSQNVTPETQEIWSEALQLVGRTSFVSNSVEPSKELFEKYRDYLRQYTVLPQLHDDIQEAIIEQLEVTGLTAKGWRLRVVDGVDEHARTHENKKTISIGGDYHPRSLSAVRRTTIHEVVGHAVRGYQGTLEESEGWAIVLEQLTKSSFAFRRSYRYLAVALGWGVLGKPMTFREVFDIIWRLMVIHSKYSIEKAKQYAFDECYRAYRGGLPAIAGAVYLKDAVYFDASMRIWHVLNSGELSYNEFIDIIEGRRTILS